MKLIKTLILSLLFIAAGIFTAAFVAITVTPKYDTVSDVSVLANVVLIAACAACALVCAAGLIRVKYDSPFGFVSTLSHITVILLIGFIGILFMMPPVIVTEWVTCVCVILLLAAVSGSFVGSVSKRIPAREPPKTAPMQKFTADKAKWYVEDAADEYCRLSGKTLDDLTDDENDMLYTYAAMPMTYFFMWLADRGYLSESFFEAADHSLVAAVIRRDKTPDELVAAMDYVLASDDIVPELSEFMDSYYEQGSLRYTLYSLRYMFDYYFCVKDRREVCYLHDFSWEVYDRIAARIDRAFAYFNTENDLYDDDGESVRTLTCPCFDTKIEVDCSLDVDGGYFERSTALLTDMSDMLKARLKDELSEYYYSYGEEEAAEDIFSLYHPYTARVLRPLDDSPAIMVFGECDFDEEHGFSFVLRGEHVLEVSGYRDSRSPFSPENDIRYTLAEEVDRDLIVGHYPRERIDALMTDGTLKEVDLVPAVFGQSEKVFMPAALARCKAEADNIAETLKVLGLCDSCTCDAYYNDNCTVAKGFCTEARLGGSSAAVIRVNCT